MKIRLLVSLVGGALLMHATGYAMQGGLAPRAQRYSGTPDQVHHQIMKEFEALQALYGITATHSEKKIKSVGKQPKYATQEYYNTIRAELIELLILGNDAKAFNAKIEEFRKANPARWP